MTADLIIPKEVLQAAKISPAELKIDIAVHLYEQKKLSMGQAKRLAGLNQLEFQKEMAKRNVYVHFTIEDVKNDLANLEKL